MRGDFPRRNVDRASLWQLRLLDGQFKGVSGSCAVCPHARELGTDLLVCVPELIHHFFDIAPCLFGGETVAVFDPSRAGRCDGSNPSLSIAASSPARPRRPGGRLRGRWSGG
jgi:hypothetical protein